MNPYRPGGSPPPNDELARLAQQGQQRIAAATEGQQIEAAEGANYHLRVAIGALRGSPLRRSFLLVALVGILLGAAGIAAGNGALFDPVVANVAPIGFVLGMGGFFTYLFVAPRATRSRMIAERTYVASLPFTLEGYFEVLSIAPSYSCKLTIGIEWRTSGTDASTLQGLLGLIDTGARVTSCDARAASITTGDISGSTGISVNKSPVYRNHKLAKYLDDLIDRVLMPLHRNVGLSRVRLTRSRW
jgi:hypothetical protein